MANEPIITLVGNLTADPELRFLQSGIPVASFTVASTPREKNRQTQEWEDGETLFVRCSAWRDMGENVTNTLTKGSRVIVQGRLQSRSYEKDGQTRTSLELQVDEVGPSLRWATARIERAKGGSGQSGGYGYAGDREVGNAQNTNVMWESTKDFSDAPPF